MTLTLGDLLLGHSVAQYQVFLSLYCVRIIVCHPKPLFLLIPSGPHRNPIKYIKRIPFEAELKAVQGFFFWKMTVSSFRDIYLTFTNLTFFGMRSRSKKKKIISDNCCLEFSTFTTSTWSDLIPKKCSKYNRKIDTIIFHLEKVLILTLINITPHCSRHALNHSQWGAQQYLVFTSSEEVTDLP